MGASITLCRRLDWADTDAAGYWHHSTFWKYAEAGEAEAHQPQEHQHDEPDELALEPLVPVRRALHQHPVSERELDVLRLLATDLSNPEIADELYIAVSTVRSHCKSIYGKLDVHKRWDAVHRAVELGLI